MHARIPVRLCLGLLILLASLGLVACAPDVTATPLVHTQTATGTTEPPRVTHTPAPTQATPTQQPTFTRTRAPTRTRAATPPEISTPIAADTQVVECAGAPEITLKVGDWARVSVDPPLPNKVRSQPGLGNELLGQVEAGESVHVLEGPQCADGYTWWRVRSLDGLEGWTVEGDAAGYWLVEPISAWYQIPRALTKLGIQVHDLRELRISPDAALVSGITGTYNPLATPMPRPQNIETPEPDDPRYSDFGTASYAAHSFYDLSGALDQYLIVYDLQEALSRYYLNHMGQSDCTRALGDNLENEEPVAAYLNPFCGINGGIPLHFIAAVRPIRFEGGKGVRFLISSGNYQTVNKMEYMFQGLSDDGRYYLRGLFRPIVHPFIVDGALLGEGLGPLLAWREGQYDQAQASYDAFNARIEAMLNADAVPLYPSLELLDEMVASIVIK